MQVQKDQDKFVRMYKEIKNLIHVPDITPYLEEPSFTKQDLELFIKELNSTLEFSNYLLEKKLG